MSSLLPRLGGRWPVGEGERLSTMAGQRSSFLGGWVLSCGHTNLGCCVAAMIGVSMGVGVESAPLLAKRHQRARCCHPRTGSQQWRRQLPAAHLAATPSIPDATDQP